MDHHGSIRRLWTIFSYSQREDTISNNTIMAFSAVGAVSGLASAFLLPWFPNVCREQGMSRWQTGLVFAALDLSMLLFRWPCMQLAKRQGTRWMFFFGFAIQGGCCFGLGFVWIIKSTGFFTTVLLFRAAQGVGAAMVSAASLQVINTMVYCNVNSIGTCTESIIGLARVFGAPMGALIYHSFGGGHVALKMAFWFLAGGYAAMAVVASGTIVMPVPPPVVREREPGQPTPWSEMFGSRAIAFSLMAIFLVDFMVALLEPTLSIHLFEFFEMEIWERGLVFMEMGLMGLLAAPLAGLLGEYTSRKLVMLAGLCAGALAIVGLGNATEKGIASGFAGMLGIALSCIATPAMPAMLWDIPENSALTDGEVARVTNALAAFAAVIGPIYGSGLAEALTFKIMSFITAGVFLLFVAINVLSYWTGGAPWRNNGLVSAPSQADVEGGDEAASKPLLQKQTEIAQPTAQPALQPVAPVATKPVAETSQPEGQPLQSTASRGIFD